MKLKLALALTLISASALAQNAVLQSGPVTPYNPTLFINDHVVMDAAIALARTGKGMNPYTVTDSKSTGLSLNSALTTGQYNKLTLGHDSSNNAVIDAEAAGGALASNLNLIVNGNQFTFSSAGNFTIPGALTNSTLSSPVFTGTETGFVHDGVFTLKHLASGITYLNTDIISNNMSLGTSQTVGFINTGGTSAGWNLNLYDGPQANSNTFQSIRDNLSNTANDEQLFAIKHFSNTQIPQNIISGMAFRGTMASPIAVQSGDIATILDGRFYDGSQLSDTRAAVMMKADENFSPGHHGARMEFYTTPTGTTTPQLRGTFRSSGDLQLLAGLYGTTSNDNAPAGDVGEYTSANLASGSALALTNNTPANLTGLSLSLTAGDWDVSGVAQFTGGATTTVTYLIAALSTTSASVAAPVDQMGLGQANLNNGTVFASTSPYSVKVGPTRVSVDATTTVYLNVQGGFGTSTLSGYGMIRARRVR